jgi:hypothetical protein
MKAQEPKVGQEVLLEVILSSRCHQHKDHIDIEEIVDLDTVSLDPSTGRENKIYEVHGIEIGDSEGTLP